MTDEQNKRLAQLKHALDLGAIDQDTYDMAVAALSAQLTGSGAIAQGQDALSVGAGGVGITGDHKGDINTGTVNNFYGVDGKPDPVALQQAYLTQVFNHANVLPLLMEARGKGPVQLSGIYTALRTNIQRIKFKDNQDFEEIVGSGLEKDLHEGGRQNLSALETLNRYNYLVLLGGPGSGKSTFANFVALCMSGEMLDKHDINLKLLCAPLPREEDDEKKDQEPTLQEWQHGPLLPVQVVLRDFAAELPTQGGVGTAELLWRHIENNLKEMSLFEYAPVLKKHLLTEGGLMVLDGLDEVPEAEARREQIRQVIQQFTTTFSKCRYLITSRTYAYEKQGWVLPGFNPATLQDFSPAQIKHFVEAWYAHIAQLDWVTKSDATSRAEQLKETIENNVRLADLARRPLLLTLMARLQTLRGGTLPTQRQQLYEESVQLLLSQWEGMKKIRVAGQEITQPSLSVFLQADPIKIRRQLEAVALIAHRDQKDLQGTADIPEQTITHGLLEIAAREMTVGELEALKGYLRDRAGVLNAHGVGWYQFPHRTFQEYLAACHLTDNQFPKQLVTLLRAEPNRWREATLLAALKLRAGSSASVWQLLRALCPHDPPHVNQPLRKTGDDWAALLAGQVLNETTPNVEEEDEDIHRRTCDWQAYLLTCDLPPAERALAGRNLALAGDPRKGVGLINGLPDIDWVTIPDDSAFIYGEGDAQQSLRLPAFKISRYPITLAQFQAFVDAGDEGVNNPRWWEGLAADADHKREPGEQYFKFANHPRENASWYDAVAFCRWLSDKLGAEVSLPTEWEWEKAARGLDGRIYPWGNDYIAGAANIDEHFNNVGPNDLAMTSAVGMYAQGVSPYGVMDMSGNVWEWCLNEYQTPDNTQLTGSERRVLRGGSWLDDDDDVRCACRFWDLPDDRTYHLGFRVVVRSAPVSSTQRSEKSGL